MDSVLKNIAISGAVVFLILGAFAYVQLQNSRARIIEAELAVTQLGVDDAIHALESEERYLLAAAYGWGPQEIPGFDKDLYDKCLVGEVGLRIYWDYTDVFYEPAAGDYFKALSSMPANTEIYARSFNETMLELLRSSSATACRIPLGD